MVNKVWVWAGGALAGFLNGLLGTGGGIVIIYVLSRLNKNGDKKDNYASAIASVLPISIVSAGFYLKRGSFQITEALPYILPAVAGGLAGALLLCKIKAELLRKIFAFIVIYSGVNLII